MDVLVEGEEMEVSRSIPMSETSLSEQDRSQVILRAMFNGDKTYDNQTEEIQRNWITTYREWNCGFQAQVSYQDVVWEASVTRVAVCMGVKETGVKNGFSDPTKVK